MIPIRIIGFLVLVLISFHSYSLEVTAQVDKNPVLLDEAFILTVTAIGDVNREAFKSDVLLKDFVVGNTSVSSQTQMINFDTTRSTTWRTTLFPRREGSFIIPALTINGVKTSAISLQVLPAPTSTSTEQRDFFVTSELAKNSAYVQEHITYTVKLYMANNIERGSLQAPEMQDATIQQIGEDRQFSDIVNGKRFQVIERKYAIIPQSSGNFAIQAPIFSGEVLATNSRQSFGFFNRTRNITRRGTQLTLDVKPIPANITGQWLPSEFVELTETWPNDKNFVVGEPITRTYTLTVVGQTEEQLPEIKSIYPPSLKTYPDQSETVSTQKNGQIIAQRIQSTAIIPSTPGSIVLPGATVNWFNTRTQQVEQASIPARTIMVEPSKEAETSSPLPNPAVTDTRDSSEKPDLNNPLIQPANNIWIGLTVTFALLWLITLIMLLRTRTRVNNTQPSSQSAAKIDSSEISLETLLASVNAGQHSTIQRHLTQWLQHQLNRPTYSLPQLLSLTEASEISAQYNKLLANRFSAESSRWSSAPLLAAIKAFAAAQKTKQKTSHKTVPALYPIN